LITGRPTKLTDEIIAEARAYLDATDISVATLLPTIEGLAQTIHIHRDTIYQWEKDNKDFSDILEDLRQMQANKIIQNSMQNRYNPTISKMMLSKHGYVEKQEIEAKVENVTPILSGKSRADNIKSDIKSVSKGEDSVEISELIPEDD